MLATLRYCAIYALLSISAFYLCACSSDETRFSNDPTSVAKVRALSTKLNSGQQLAEVEFNELKKLYEQYPKSESLRKPFETALFLRKDWATLATFYDSMQGSEMAVEHKRNHAKVYVKLGDYEKALELTKTIDLKTDADMRHTAATSLFQLGKYDEAKKILDESWSTIEKEKRIDEITLRGMIYFYEGDNAKAVETLTKATAINENSIPANNGLSRVYTAMGDDEKASAALKRVQTAFDEITQSERQKTILVEQGHKLQNAFKAKRFEEVIALGPEMIAGSTPQNRLIIYQYMYNSYVALGKTEEAKEVLEKAKQLQQK
jgi:tetratricopeptide (TPR) repeat protein